jgi:hypothetical protein
MLNSKAERRRYCTSGRRRRKEIEVWLVFDQGDGYTLTLTLESTADDRLFLVPGDEFIFVGNKDRTQTFRVGIPTLHHEQGPEAGISDPEIRTISDSVRFWRLYHLNDTSTSSPIRKTARVDDNRFLQPNGSNLPAFLYYLREKHTVEYSLIVRTVQRVAPFFEDFQLEPRGLDSTDIRLEWRHSKSDQYFDASSLSDGTLRFIVLATLFLQPQELRPSLILVDEPELGLHPYAIEMLAALVRQASDGSLVDPRRGSD